MARIVVSISTGRSTWRPLAPRAARIASSLRRAMVRASTRFAVFAQAISRTKPTAPKQNQQRQAGHRLPDRRADE